MAVKLLADTASDIDLKEAERLGIYIIPMEINFGDELYLDGVNLSHEEFFNKLVETDVMPKTSQINEYAFKEKFEELTADGSDVICITMSSKLSGTYNNAVAAAKEFGGKVRVVDSLNITIGEKVLVSYAIRLINSGLGADDAVKELNARKGRVQMIALVDTLEYLQKGGRVSKLAAVAGTIMGIKPVLAMMNGEVKVIGKAMGSKKGSNMLVRQVDNFGGIDFGLPFMAGYSGLSDALLQKYIVGSKALWEGKTDCVPVNIIGSTIGTHAGPGAIAVAFFSNNAQ